MVRSALKFENVFRIYILRLVNSVSIVQFHKNRLSAHIVRRPETRRKRKIPAATSKVMIRCNRFIFHRMANSSAAQRNISNSATSFGLINIGHCGALQKALVRYRKTVEKAVADRWASRAGSKRFTDGFVSKWASCARAHNFVHRPNWYYYSQSTWNENIRGGIMTLHRTTRSRAPIEIETFLHSSRARSKHQTHTLNIPHIENRVI